MLLMRYSFLIFSYFSILIIRNCSSTLLDRLRKEKRILFQSTLSSPREINLREESKLQLTCSFLSNFDRIDLFWLHNGTLIESFLSKNIVQKENDYVDNSFLSVSLISTINIQKIHLDMNGFYQCIAVHDEVYAEQTFNVHINTHENYLTTTSNFSRDAMITVYTAEALFEPRKEISLMCRMDNQGNDQCQAQWFDQNNQLLNTLGEKTDLVIENSTFDDHMGLYTCRICCSNHCQKFTSFVYPITGEENEI